MPTWIAVVIRSSSRLAVRDQLRVALERRYPCINSRLSGVSLLELLSFSFSHEYGM